MKLFPSTSVVWVYKPGWVAAIQAYYLGPNLVYDEHILEVKDLTVHHWDIKGYFTATEDEIFGTLDEILTGGTDETHKT